MVRVFFYYFADLHIIVRGMEDADPESEEASIDLEGLDEHLYLASVPKWKPLTRAQFSNAQKYWPCNFHENKR